ncbi:hypothetical protein HanRHA438_Chr17g0823831 [Helianthus annuus]|nr:hypothetical protein HanRHA438_Chr17g0823831 [Helianthus annuus]
MRGLSDGRIMLWPTPKHYAFQPVTQHTHSATIKVALMTEQVNGKAPPMCLPN